MDNQLAVIMAELEQLKAENTALKEGKRKPAALSFKVSKKGAISVYGLGRFPVTLYSAQWTKLLGIAGDIATFIETHKEVLATKEVATVTTIKTDAA